MKHLDNMAKVMLATGLIVAYGYAMEAFFGWYSANQYERFMLWNRMTGPYFLFMKFVPMISIFEVRTLLPEAKVHVPHGHDTHGSGH
jgi:hypothetical protein